MNKPLINGSPIIILGKKKFYEAFAIEETLTEVLYLRVLANNIIVSGRCAAKKVIFLTTFTPSNDDYEVVRLMKARG